MSAEDKNIVSDNKIEKTADANKRSSDNLNADRSVTSGEVKAAEGTNPNRPSGSASEKPDLDDASLQIVDAISGVVIAERPKDKGKMSFTLDSRYQTHEHSKNDKILKDPDAKVVFWAGKKHGEDPAGNYNIAVEVLRNHGHNVATVRPEESRFPQDTLTRLLPDLNKAVAIPTSKTPVLASLPTDSRSSSFVEHYGDWDIVIAFPDPYKTGSRATGF